MNRREFLKILEVGGGGLGLALAVPLVQDTPPEEPVEVPEPGSKELLIRVKDIEAIEILYGVGFMEENPPIRGIRAYGRSGREYSVSPGTEAFEALKRMFGFEQ